MWHQILQKECLLCLTGEAGRQSIVLLGLSQECPRQVTPAFTTLHVSVNVHKAVGWMLQGIQQVGKLVNTASANMEDLLCVIPGRSASSLCRQAVQQNISETKL